MNSRRTADRDRGPDRDQALLDAAKALSEDVKEKWRFQTGRGHLDHPGVSILDPGKDPEKKDRAKAPLSSDDPKWGDKLPRSVDEMADPWLKDACRELEDAAKRLKEEENDFGPQGERAVERLTAELDTLANGKDAELGTLESIRKELEDLAGKARGDLEGVTDPDQRQVRQDRAASLDRAEDVARAALDLQTTREMQSITVVGRHDVQDPNREARQSARQEMGGPAKDVPDNVGPNDQYEWLHVLARCLGGVDKEGNFVTGQRAANVDMLALEWFAKEAADKAKIEIEITAGRMKETREGLELRYSMWADGERIIDAKLDLGSNERNAELAKSLQDLRELRKGLQEERARQDLDEIVRRLQDRLDDEED
jgi:hypothetical protein